MQPTPEAKDRFIKRLEQWNEEAAESALEIQDQIERLNNHIKKLREDVHANECAIAGIRLEVQPGD